MGRGGSAVYIALSWCSVDVQIPPNPTKINTTLKLLGQNELRRGKNCNIARTAEKISAM